MTTPRTVKAIDLDRSALGHWVTVIDHNDDPHHGRLNRIELSADERTRVVLRIATQEPTESGGTYWSDFLNERYVNRDALVTVGEWVAS